MADIHDVMHAERAATDAIYATETLLGQLEDGERPGEQYDALVVAQSNLAIARAVQALAVRLDYVAYDVLARTQR